ncbi:MAG: AAA family ATPase [Cyanobacteria bacterium P01_E01_bin.42]
MHHFLIGIPASGKSTFAQLLARVIPNAAIASTDGIREKLYSDESIQGNWHEVEAEAFREIREAVSAGKTIIYDATNSRRHYRLNWLHALADLELDWLAWWLDTPIKTCKQRNRDRRRKVPVHVLESMSGALKQFPPIVAEGFAMVSKIKPDADEGWLKTKLAGVAKSQQQHFHRTSNYQWHAYSNLPDCDRLLHLIALLLENARDNEEMLGSCEALCTAMTQRWGKLYGEKEAIARDLQWLAGNGILAEENRREWDLEDRERNHAIAHAYSDRDTFLRVMETIRFIARHPFEREAGKSIQEGLLAAMQRKKVAAFQALETLQKDIERILKPYGILEGKPYRRGYFVGMGVFNRVELNRIYNALQSIAPHSDDPEIADLFDLVQYRLRSSDLLQGETEYPLRILGNQSIIDRDRLPGSSLARQPETVENAILAGEMLELLRLPGSGAFAGDTAKYFLAYPLQLVFHNIAWYLGLEIAGGEQKGLLRFERLDRLALGQWQHRDRDREEQYHALAKLHRLYDASAGLYLGSDPQVQRQFLQGENCAAIAIELWVTSEKYRFIAEATQRFDPKKLKLSPPPERPLSTLDAKLFCLKGTKNRQFPHRLRVTLPIWCVDDIELQRWILGFGGHIQVMRPESLRQKIIEMGRAIASLYEQNT